MTRPALQRFLERYRAHTVDFAGHTTALHYGSVLDEHRACREGAALFDVCHLGRIVFRGRDAAAFLERVCSRTLAGMRSHSCRYSVVCNENGGVKEDVLVYRLDDGWLMVSGGGGRQNLLQHFAALRAGLAVEIEDRTAATTMVAVQGPRSVPLVAELVPGVSALKRFAYAASRAPGFDVTVSRTGYTGEDGVEIIVDSAATEALLERLAAYIPRALAPAGLGARYTLRLEAGLPAFGLEMNEDIDPLTAGLDVGVSLDKKPAAGDDEAFVGQRALQRIARDGPTRRLVGLRIQGDLGPGQGMAVWSHGAEIGRITSGVMFAPVAPTLGYPIALAYVAAREAQRGALVEVELGEGRAPAEIVDLPFYRRT